jgi:very-short-patch-repair endonuclease
LSHNIATVGLSSHGFFVPFILKTTLMTRIKPFSPTQGAFAQDTASPQDAFLLQDSIELPYLIWKEIPPHLLFDPNDAYTPKRSLYQYPYAIRGVPLTVKTSKPLPRNPALKKYARQMRNESTMTEILFWVQVTKGRFHNIDFDRQRVIGNYIVDFYVNKLQLIIEIDGDSHKGKECYDAMREAELKAFGLTMYRIDAADVKYRIKTTMFKLEQFILDTYGVGQNDGRE